jgi:endonuclease/exonuclease/phosphatase family metal-dependent hydrolase
LLFDPIRLAKLDEHSFQFGTNQVAACVAVRDVVTGLTHVLCSAHFKAGGECETVRQKQVAVLADTLAEIASRYETDSIVMCADLNGEPQNKAHQALIAAGFASAMAALLGGREPKMTTAKKRGTFEKRCTIDYVMVQGTALRPVRYLEIPSAEQVGFLPNWVYPSDHIMLCVGFASN